MSPENLSLDTPAQAANDGGQQAATTPEAGSGPTGEEAAEQTPEQTGQEGEGQQQEGAESGAQEGQEEGQEAAPAATPELPEGFESVEDLVAAYNEQKAALDGNRNPNTPAKGQQAEQAPQRRASRFQTWKQEDWVKGMSEKPIDTIGEAAVEYFENSGAGHDLIQASVSAMMQKLGPMFTTLEPVIVKSLCDGLETQYPAFAEYRKEVEGIVRRTGDSPETVFLKLMARNTKRTGPLGQKVQQATNVLKGQARVAATAQAGGVRPASAAKPAQPAKPDALDRLTGTSPRKTLSV
jgi:hypothetical protein